MAGRDTSFVTNGYNRNLNNGAKRGSQITRPKRSEKIGNTNITEDGFEENSKKRKVANSEISEMNNKKKKKISYTPEEDGEEENPEEETSYLGIPVEESDVQVDDQKKVRKSRARTKDAEPDSQDGDFETKPTLTRKAVTKKKTTGKRNGRLQKKDQQGQLENLCTEISNTKAIIKNLSQGQNDPSFINAILAVVDELINELSIEVCFEVHHKLKTGRVCQECEAKRSLNTIDYTDVDIFGQNMNNYTPGSFACKNEGCNRVISASRYAGHLEKCMGLNTRGSTRVRRSITNRTTTKTNGGTVSRTGWNT